MLDSRSSSGGSLSQSACAFRDAGDFCNWFSEHFSLDGKPYTLDQDQAQAVLDNHKNTLVVARAGSGKTRVIVAKIAYLLATKQLQPREIAAFMFNRAATAEVNQRITQVKFDGRQILDNQAPLKASGDVSAPALQIASTFHKFALDLVKLSGTHPEIISEVEHDRIIKESLHQALAVQNRRVPSGEFDATLKTISGFVARAGQKYSGPEGLQQLRIATTQNDPNAKNRTDSDKLHQLALATFENYLSALRPPRLDFNIMMAEASKLLRQAAADPRRQPAISTRVTPLKLILIDEYQDFSQLFLNLIQSIRENCPSAHLFAVGDDWQAINRFAGSDVDYFINFTNYFPEDTVQIPLLTNYRSCRRVVENANKYMLKNYDLDARRAVAFNHKSGKIIRLNPEKTRFDASDIHEDALGDARCQIALAEAANQATTSSSLDPTRIPSSAAKLLKTVLKILRKNRRSEIMLLHRHNYTTFPNISLETFHQALRLLVVEEGIMNAEIFDAKVRTMTMHKSKGLEAPVVILLEANRDLILGHHPEADLWKLFGDSLATEKSDQHRLLYVAMTRAKQKLYILSTDRKAPF